MQTRSRAPKVLLRLADDLAAALSAPRNVLLALAMALALWRCPA